MSKQIFYRIALILCLLFVDARRAESMQLDQADHGVAQAALVNPQPDGYDSDSEDEEGYEYNGFAHLAIADATKNSHCIALARGIHFSPSHFNKQKRSELRKAQDAGHDIYSSAAYDLAKVQLGADDQQEIVKEQAIVVRDQIKSLKKKSRNTFQQIYSNQYDKFHGLLGTDKEGGAFKAFTSKKNPQVSTAEDFFHAAKYAGGLKFLGNGITSLDPEYDAEGKPKHPYIGKISLILIKKDVLKEMDPYFVVHGHANDNITIYHHFSNNILAEREVSFPGLIEGNHVVFSVPIRVPSFKGDYKPWYQEKYGITETSYKRCQKTLKTGKYHKDEEKPASSVRAKMVHNLLLKKILPHYVKKLEKHIQDECDARKITLVYKQLSGHFGKTLPTIEQAQEKKGQKRK